MNGTTRSLPGRPASDARHLPRAGGVKVARRVVAVRAKTLTAGAVDDEFVGRTNELAAVVAAVATAGEGVGGAVIVRGEAGIGKTALLAHGLRDAALAGWHVLHVRPDTFVHQIRFAALARAVRLDAGPRSRVGAERAAAALDTAHERPFAEVHHVVAQYFSALRSDAPTLLAVDDLPRVDDGTITLIANLLRVSARHPLVLAGTQRTPDSQQPSSALAGLLGRLEQDGVARLVDLGPMEADDVAALVSALVAQRPSDELVAFVRRVSGDNPFLVEQTVLHLVETGAIGSEDVACGLVRPISSMSPDRRSALLERMVPAGRDVRRVGRAVALLRSLALPRLDLVAELTGLTPADAGEAFDTLVDGGVLRQSGDGSFRFSHQLVCDALYGGLGPAQRRQWHRLAAEKLASVRRYAADDVEVATHIREIVEFGDQRAIAIMAKAAEATCRAVPRSSIPWYREALTLTPRDDPAHARLTGRLARALFLSGRPVEAVGLGRQALERLPAGRERTRLASLVIEALSVKLSDVHEAAKLIERERAAGTSSLRLTAQAAHAFAATGRQEQADDAAAQVLAALRDASPSEQINALVELVHMSVATRFSSLPGVLDRLAEAAERAPRTARLTAFLAMSYGWAARGDTAACTAAIAQTKRLLDDAGWELYRPDLLVVESQNAANLGDWDDALRSAGAAMDSLAETGSLAVASFVGCLQAELLADRGKLAAARRAVGHASPRHPVTLASSALASARIDALSGGLANARRCLTGQLAAGGIPRQIHLHLLIRLAEVDLELGDDATARATLSEVEAAAGVRELSHPASVQFVLAKGRAHHDIDAVRQAVAIADEHALALLRGRARLALGSMDVDPQGNLREAWAIFRSLRADPWTRRATTALRERGLPVPRSRTRPSTLLTQSEEQIARLVQLGRSNPEIADAVHLSVKTVERYLSRVYRKTGCANRFALARALDRGLLD